MTQKPFNIHTILEEFEEFYQINGLRINGGKWIGKDSVEKFLISSIRRSMEAVRPDTFEDREVGYGDTYENGREQYERELLQNINNFFNKV